MKKFWAVLVSVALCVSMMAGCGVKQEAKPDGMEPGNTQDDVFMPDAQERTDREELSADTQDQTADDTVIRVGGLKGPTSMGLAKLLHDAASHEAACEIDYTLAVAADELTPAFIQGNLDMIAVPSNLASVLYNKTEGAVRVLAVNTLGVTYIVETGDAVRQIEDLKGKTIYATGQGATPEYTLRYLLQQKGLDPDADVTIEWKSEPTEIVSLMASGSKEVIAMLPQPFVTVAQSKVDNLRVAVDMNEQWEALGGDSALITGVLVARADFADGHPALVSTFLEEYQASISFANSQVEEAAVMVEELDIVKADIARKALPNCNITFLAGEEMKTALGGFLQVLYEQNPASVGGTLPADDFYYGLQ